LLIFTRLTYYRVFAAATVTVIVIIVRLDIDLELPDYKPTNLPAQLDRYVPVVGHCKHYANILAY
jgi:hypothetical protein